MIQSNGVLQTGQTTSESMSRTFVEMAMNWHHDWTPDLSHELSAGFFLMQSDGATPLPAGSAGVSWHRFGNEIVLRAGQSAESNIYIGAAYERRFVTLSLGLPINRRETLRLSADTNLEHDSITANSTGGQGSANVFAARVALRWQPGETFTYGLEYSFRDQRAATIATGTSFFSSFRRQMAMLTIEARYPSVVP